MVLWGWWGKGKVDLGRRVEDVEEEGDRVLEKAEEEGDGAAAAIVEGEGRERRNWKEGNADGVWLV